MKTCRLTLLDHLRTVLKRETINDTQTDTQKATLLLGSILRIRVVVVHMRVHCSDLDIDRL